METTFLERLEAEQQELDTKIVNLAQFLSGTPGDIVSDEELKLLRHQYITMQEYNQVLIQRIKLHQ
jgi:hypothetical protein